MIEKQDSLQNVETLKRTTLSLPVPFLNEYHIILNFKYRGVVMFLLKSGSKLQNLVKIVQSVLRILTK